jgi:hypothetical protein
MKKMTRLAALAILCTTAAWAGQAPIAPQTARQALIEMFFSKTQGTFAKHLPAAAIAALEKSGALATLQMYSAMLGQAQTQGQNVQTYETGSILLSTDNAKTGDKLEVTVESDSLSGDQDDIQLAFQLYKNGQAVPMPVKSQLTFSMKQEKEIWKLNEIAVTIRVPLADPDFLKAITERATARASATAAPQVGTPQQSSGGDAQIVAAMRTILTAEITYAATYPAVGFTCSLSDLDGFGGGQPNEHQAMLINSGLASGKRYGYVFTLSGCSTSPASAFHLTAAPSRDTFGKIYCADQAGVVRTSNGNPATCFSNGTSVQ